MDNRIRVVANLIVTTLLVLLPADSHSAPPDLCDEPVRTIDGGLYEDSTGLTISRWCEPHTAPPAWTGAVCCSITDEAACERPMTTGRCKAGTTRYECDYAEQIGANVVCYEPGPGACGLGFCVAHEPVIPEAELASLWICCLEIVNDLVCHFAGATNNGELPGGDCGGSLSICNYGQSNLNGTVTCYD